jgi:glycosyltransferase involved in cell wall biosynthesis
MRIGIDASRTASAQRTGTENYSLHLIRALLSLPTSHRFRLYFNRRPPAGLIEGDAEHRVLPFPRLWTHVRLSWEMLTQPPDVLFVPSHVLPLVRPARSLVTVHDLGYHYYPRAHTAFQNLYLRWSTRFNARCAFRVLADSEATCRDLIQFYRVPPGRIAVVYPGRDESLRPVQDPAVLAAVRARYGLAQHYFLYVGTLHPRKNLVRLVQAFARVAGDLDPGLQLVLGGKQGWLHQDILAEVQRLGLGTRVVLPGYVPADDLPALLSGALAFAFPSLYEGFGFPVLEAMACGTPVLCSNASSLPEVAGDAALLADPLDVEALAAGLRRLASDADLRRSLAARGSLQVQRFSWPRAAAAVLELVEEAGRALD